MIQPKVDDVWYLYHLANPGPKVVLKELYVTEVLPTGLYLSEYTGHQHPIFVPYDIKYAYPTKLEAIEAFISKLYAEIRNHNKSVEGLLKSIEQARKTLDSLYESQPLRPGV